jgi:hypothetical protein
MHTHQPHFAEVVSTSSNGRTASSTSRPVDAHPSLPDYSQEDLTTNAAVKSWEFGYDLGDTTLEPEVQVPTDDGIPKPKRKVYDNSVRGLRRQQSPSN